MNGIVGRAAELEAVERFLGAVRERPAALVIEGEAGIGKTTMWQKAVAQMIPRSGKQGWRRE